MLHAPVQVEGPTGDSAYRFHYASECLERGYSVVPVRGKTPAVCWKRHQSERASLEDIDRWFGRFSGTDFNVGIVTGKVSDLVVVDVDSRADIRFWKDNRPATPILAETGGGGMHFYYRYPKGETIGNRVRVLKRSIDIRGDGGLVVAPPSLHPETGQPYRWLSPFDEYRLSDVPHFDVRWIEEPTRPKAQLRGAFGGVGPIRDVRSYIRRIPAISGQQGHNATFRVACLLKEAGLSQAEALAELADWSRDCADPPWTDKELQHKIDSVYRDD